MLLKTLLRTPLKSLPICGILTPGLGPAGYLGPINGCVDIIWVWGGGGCEWGEGWLEGCVGGDGLIVEFWRTKKKLSIKLKIIHNWEMKIVAKNGQLGENNYFES